MTLLLGACGASKDIDSTALPAGAAICDPAQQFRLGGLDLQTATVLDLQAALARGALSSVALVERQLQLIEAFDRGGPALNSVLALAPDALEQARAADARRAAGQQRGVLDGITVLLKDNIGTTDMPTTAGSIALADNIPLREATITRRLREAGAIVLGKVNLSEFANWVSLQMPNGYSSLGGQVLAPYGATIDPLGSSTGSGVAAAMGLATLTVGTETSGSIISPAAVQSVVGLKPTLGLVSRIGIIPLAPSFDTAGPMTRNVTDAAALLQVLAYADSEDPASAHFSTALDGVAPNYLAALSTEALQGARIGVRSADRDEMLRGGALFSQALDLLRAQGAELIDIDNPLIVAESGSIGAIGAIPNEFKLSLNRYLASEAGPDTAVDDLAGIIRYNEQHPDRVKYGQDLLIASDAQSGLEVDPLYVASRDATILSQQTVLTQLFDGQQLDAIVSWYLGWSNITQTAAAGYPNLTVPMGYGEDGMPIGIEFAGLPFSEDRLLAYAYDYEQASRARIPPTLKNPQLNAQCGQPPAQAPAR
ncbi:MAG TPA: amidase family protein [Fontimonas sp.]